MNLHELFEQYQNDRRAADARAARLHLESKAILDKCEAEGERDLTPQEFERFTKLVDDRDAARDASTRAEIKMAKVETEMQDEDEVQRKSAMRIPTKAALDNTTRTLDVTPRMTRDSNGNVIVHTRDRADNAPVWRRDSDGRPAAVERGQRFADHEVTREVIERTRGRDELITGAYGDIGQQIRAMTTTSGSAIVPSVWAADIIDRARNYAAVYQAGAQSVPMDRKVVQIGRLTTDPVGAFRAEGSTITASDPVFDNVTLTSKTLSALVIGSMEWFADATNAGELVSEALAKALALQVDLVSLFGGVTTGAEQTATGNNMLPSGGLPNPPNPSGILAGLLANASSSVLGSAANGTAQTAASFYGELLDTLYTVRDFNESANALLWPSHLARIYAKAADTTNQPMRQPPDVEQIQKFVTNQIPSGFTQGTGTLMSDLVVGDFTQLLIGQRLDLQVQTLVERYAELGQVGILATWRGDVQLARPRAFAVYRYLKGT